MSESFTTSGETLSVEITGDTQYFLPDTSSAPVTADFDTGELDPVELSLELFLQFSDVGEAITITADVGAASQGVQSLQFSIFDVDLGASAFQDEVTIYGSLDGNAVSPTLTAGVSHTVAGNVATGQSGADSTSADGTLVVTFIEPIDQFVISYTNGPSAPNPPLQQAISIHDIFTCPRLLPEISATKTVSSYDPLGSGQYGIPGNDVIYTISASNNGTASTDPDSIVLIDALPPEVTFYNGDIDGAGPETHPVSFNQINTSALMFNYATDVKFSDSVTKPSDYSGCNYTPTSGYDPAVRFVCLNPKGELESGNPAPSFSLLFRSRIN